MSLTWLINGKTEEDLEFQHILRKVIPTRDQFYTLSDHDAFSSQYSKLVPYHLNEHYHSAILGTAFDYVARLVIAQYISSEDEEVSMDKTSNKGLYMLIKMTSSEKGKELIRKYHQGLKTAEHFVKHSKDITMDVLIHSTFMARLEHIIRSGRLPASITDSLLSEEDEKLLLELEKMSQVFMDGFIVPEVITHDSDVIFNPHFGNGSIACGGADADIFIDGVLYDFKTTKRFGYRWQDIAQMFGYYMLHDISKKQGDKSAMLFSRDVKKLAFYKARFGEIEFIDIKTLDLEKMERVVKQVMRVLNL